MNELEHLKEELQRLKQEIRRQEIRKKIIANTNALLDRSLYELSVINKINITLSKTLNYLEAINEVINLLSQMIEYVAAGILIYREDVSLLRIYHSSLKTKGFIEDFKEKTLRKGKSLFGFLEEENLSIQIANPSLVIPKNEKDGVFCIEGMPFKIGDRVIGLLSIAKDSINPFSSDDMRLIKILVDNSSMAIENALLHKKIEELAIIDGLTGVYNYRYFKEMLYKEIKRAERYSLIFSILMFDIDDFKKINDTYGHIKGDEVLKEVCQIAKEVFQREIDVVARYGGEEFAIILPQTPKKKAAIIGEKLVSLVRERLFLKVSLKHPITISLGIASYPDDGNTEIEIIEKVDKALYEAKRRGKDKVVLI